MKLGRSVTEITRNVPYGTISIPEKGYIVKAEPTKFHNTVELKDRFFAKFPEMLAIAEDDRSIGFIVAGGSCLNTIKEDGEVKDIDIFIVDELFVSWREHLVVAMRRKIQSFVNLVVEHCGLIDSPKAVSITSKVITLHTVKCGEVQIILRPTRDVSALLSAFDIQCAALGIILHEKRAVIHRDAINAFQSMTNIYNASRCSPTYCIRFEKYFKRGFSIFISEEDVNKIDFDWKAEKFVQLPGVTIHSMIMKLH